MPDTQTILSIAIPAAVIIGGVVAGLFLEKVILRWLETVAEWTSWRADNVIFKSIRGVPIFWGAAAGIYLATLTFDIPQGLAVWLGRALVVALIGSVTIIAARIAGDLTTSFASREQSFLPPTSIIPGMIRVLVYIVGFLLILSTLSVDIAPLLTALGVGGLAVALALQNTLANVFAGLYLIASRQINPGDYVRMESGEEGYTLDVDWRSTTIRSILGNTIIIPNSRFVSSIVTNYSLRGREIHIRTPVAVDYESDLRKVERLALEVARDTMSEVVPRAAHVEPQVFLHTFGEFSLNLTVVLAVHDFRDQYRLRHEFMIRIIERFRTEGIRIPFPIKEFEMELSTEGLDADRRGELSAPDWREGPASEMPPPDDGPGAGT